MRLSIVLQLRDEATCRRTRRTPRPPPRSGPDAVDHGLDVLVAEGLEVGLLGLQRRTHLALGPFSLSDVQLEIVRQRSTSTTALPAFTLTK